MQDLEDLICTVLRGEQPAWPWDDDPEVRNEFLRLADAHGISALLYQELTSVPWPPVLLESLRLRAVHLTMWELRHQQVLTTTLGALSRAGIEPILIKGTALAYSLYQNPALRTRADTDLLIPPDVKEGAHAELIALGYKRELAVAGNFVSYQANYSFRANDESGHTVDLHWKINNSELLSRLFTYAELRACAQPVPQLYARAWAASRVHALLLACMHRATHKNNPYYVDGVPHPDSNRLAWLYDIHLLAKALDGPEWAEFTHLAARKGLRAVCLDGFHFAQTRLHTRFPEEVLGALSAHGEAEPIARYFGSGSLRQHWMDFRALGSVARQLKFVHEILLPPAGYMRGKYADHPSAWLPILYVRRAADGVAKRMARNRSP